MGIRLHCPNGHSLHVKAFLAGKRGICPECGVKIDIPGDSGQLQSQMQPTATNARNALNRQSAPRVSTGSWYIRIPSGEQFGPADESTFQEWVSQGRVNSNCLVWREGWPEWREASTVLVHKDDLEKQRLSQPTTVRSTPIQIMTSTSSKSAVKPGPSEIGARSASSDTFSAVVRIETDRPAPKSRQKSRRLLYGLVVACLFLTILMVYVLSRS